MANQRIALLHHVIDRHVREHRPATFHASQIGIPATHLNRLARDQTGRSTHQLIANRLVDQARRDLLFTRISVQGMSYQPGFSDPAYFTWFFTGQAGISPNCHSSVALADSIQPSPAIVPFAGRYSHPT